MCQPGCESPSAALERGELPGPGCVPVLWDAGMSWVGQLGHCRGLQWVPVGLQWLPVGLQWSPGILASPAPPEGTQAAAHSLLSSPTGQEGISEQVWKAEELSATACAVSMQELEQSLADWAHDMKELQAMKAELAHLILTEDMMVLKEQVEHLHRQWEELCLRVSVRLLGGVDGGQGWGFSWARLPLAVLGGNGAAPGPGWSPPFVSWTGWPGFCCKPFVSSECGTAQSPDAAVFWNRCLCSGLPKERSDKHGNCLRAQNREGKREVETKRQQKGNVNVFKYWLLRFEHFENWLVFVAAKCCETFVFFVACCCITLNLVLHVKLLGNIYSKGAGSWFIRLLCRLNVCLLCPVNRIGRGKILRGLKLLWGALYTSKPKSCISLLTSKWLLLYSL